MRFTVHFVRRFRNSALGLLIVAVISAFGIQILPAAPAGASVTVTGTGSSYAAVAINNWVGQVANLYGLSINYQTSSSVYGLNDFKAGQVTFAASEIGYSTQPTNKPPDGTYQYLPSVAGATCLMYNVPSGTHQPIQGLQLTPAILMGIFSGTITQWTDPAIAAANPGVDLPQGQSINFVYRTDPSGDNYIFSQYLQSLQPSAWGAFAAAFGYPNAPTSQWPAPQGGGGTGQYNFAGSSGVSGSDNASNAVAAQPYSITYVETAYAILHGDQCAAIQNSSGAYVQPSSVGDAIALTHDALYPDLEQDLSGVFVAPEPAAYPISAYSYLITSVVGNTAQGAVLGKFISFLACQGQVSAGQLGYSPIPPNLIADDFAAIRRIPGAAPPPALNGQDCPNPYLTGAAQYVGGPIQLSSGGGGGLAANTAAAASAAAAAGVKQVSAADAAAQLAKKNGGLFAAPGQHLGVGLQAAAMSMLNLSGPTSTIALLTLGFIAIVAIPPVVGTVRRRHRIKKESQL